MRWRAIVAISCLAAGLLIGTESAVAENPPASFMPDENGTSVDTGAILSDRDDGVDSLAHLAAVAPLATERVEWYVCPLEVNDPVTAAQFPTCSIIGVDASPTRTGVDVTPSPPDEAYELFWDIPDDLDLQLRDILVLACTGPERVIEGATANCKQSNETSVRLDNAAPGSGQETSSGSIVSYCIDDADPDGPGSGTTTAQDPCEVQPGADPLTAAQRAAVDGRFRPFGHGWPVPENGFVLRVLTSADMAGGEVRAVRDFGADANADPAAAEQDVACSNLGPEGTGILWECAFPNDLLARDNNSEQAVFVYETSSAGSGSGFCAGAACRFDSLYVASTSSFVTARMISMTIVGGDASCSAPVTTTTASSEDLVGLVGCLRESFGTDLAGPVTFELSGPGEFITCGTGAAHDHDGDSAVEHCHGSTTTDGRFSGVSVGSLFELGVQEIKFCSDTENAPTGAVPAGHGCADETLVATGSIRRVPRPSQVHLLLAEGASEDCHEGSSYANAQVGDVIELVACTQARDPDSPATTDQVNGGRLFWALEPGGTQSVSFVGAPPTETSVEDGKTTVLVQAERFGTPTVIVRLCNEAGSCGVAEARVELNITGGETQCSDGIDNDSDGAVDRDDLGCESWVDDDETVAGVRVDSIVTGSFDRQRDRFEGEVDSDETACLNGRNVTVRKMASGRDPAVARGSSNRDGNWSARPFRKRVRPGRYYAKVRSVTVELVGGRDVLCKSDRSETFRIR